MRQKFLRHNLRGDPLKFPVQELEIQKHFSIEMLYIEQRQNLGKDSVNSDEFTIRGIET